MGVKMLGYLITDERLLSYGLAWKLGTDQDKNAKENTIVEAATHIFVRGGMFGHGRLVGVTVNGKLHTCLAVACNDPNELFPLPSRERLNQFKKLLKTDKEPSWYKYA